MDFAIQAINCPTYLKDLTGISDLIKSDTCSKMPPCFAVNSEKLSSVRCLLLGAGTLGCDVARILMVSVMFDVTFVLNYKHILTKHLFNHGEPNISGLWCTEADNG